MGRSPKGRRSAGDIDGDGANHGPRAPQPRPRRWRLRLEHVGLVVARPDGFRYHGFISYSHAADGALAPALQHGLQRFAKPWYRMRALHIFRDDAALSASPHLWASICEALDASDFFILLASPRAAASPWIAKEAVRWCDTKPIDHLLIGVSAGVVDWSDETGDFDWSTTTAVPRALEGQFMEEPRFIDLRWARNGDDLTLSHPLFRDAVAEFAAPLHHRPKDELASEEVREHKRTLRIARTGVVVLVALTIAAVLSAVVAVRQREAAVDRQHVVESQKLAADATVNLEADPELSVLLSLEALHVHYTGEAERELRLALPEMRTLVTMTAGSGVRGVAFSPDGLRAATTATDGSVGVWDATTGRRLFRMRGDRGPAFTPSFGPDGRWLLTAGNDGTARIWDTKTGRQVRGLHADDSSLYSASFSADGRRVVTGGAGTEARVWDRTSGRQLAVMRGHTNSIFGTDFSPDGSRVATASYDGTARIWDSASGRSRGILSARGIVGEIDFSPDGERLVTCGLDGTARTWDVRSGGQLVVLRGHRGTVYTARFDASGTFVVTAGIDGTARVWDAVSGRELVVLRGHDGIVRSAAFSADAHRVITAGLDGSARVWMVDPPEQRRVIEARSDGIVAAAFNRDGREVATAGDDHTARVWNAATGRLQARLRGHSGVIYDVDFSPDGTRLVTAGADGFARIWDVASEREIRALSAGPGIVYAAVFSTDGTRIATAGFNGAAIWNAATGRRVTTFSLGTPFSVALSPDGKRAVTGSQDGALRIWNATNGHQLKVLRGPRRFVSSVGFSPDAGRVVAADADDGAARIWDIASATTLTVLRGPPGSMRQASFNNDGDLVVTAHQDGSARVWNASTGKELTAFRVSEGAMYGASFSPNGSRVVTAAQDGTARIWSCALCISLERLISVAEDRVTRDLTAGERARFVAVRQ